MKKLKIAGGVSRVLQHFNSPNPAVVISAYRSEDQDGREVSLKENIKEQNDLKKKVRAMGYGFIPLRAKFKYEESSEPEEEESLLVPGMTLEEGVKLGRKFKQHSILAKDDSGYMAWVCTSAGTWKCVTVGTVIESFKKSSISDNDFVGAFSQILRGKGNAKVKRIQLSYLAELSKIHPLPISSIKDRWQASYTFIGEEE